MRTFWLCLIFSVGLHLFFFQDVLEGMLKTGEAENTAKRPDRIKIRMVKRKKPEPPKKVVKPKPKLVKAAVLPKPKPKARPKPKPKKKPVVAPKPKPQAKSKPRPKPKPRKVAQRPKPKKRTYPKSRPKLKLGNDKVPKSTSKPKPKASSSKRLTRKKQGGESKRSVATRVPSSESSSGGKAGVAPPSFPVTAPGRSDDEPYGDPKGSPDGESTGRKGGETEPVPAPAPPEPPAPPVRREVPKPAEPPPKPKPTPKPKRVATHKDLARKPIISVPNIDPPAKFRREKLQGQLRVRFRVAPDGSFKVSLSDTSGNKEFDDFVLGEIRRTANVQPGLDEEGKPKTSVVRRPVNINID